MAQTREHDESARSATFEIDGVRFGVREAGNGRPVVVFGDEAQAKALADGLATHNRVLAMEVFEAGALRANQLAQIAARAVTRIGLERFSVIGISSGSSLALALATLAPNQIDKLILLSPPRMAEFDAQISANLGQVTAPTLVMVGTRDRSGAAETMRTLREKLPACQLLFVYGAGRALITDRPDACLSPINEFLERGIEYVVCHESQVIRR